MKKLFIILCVGVYLAAAITGYNLRLLGFTAEGALFHRVTYLFAHATVLHLFLNMLSFHFLFFAVNREIRNSHLLLSAAIVGAILATFGAEMQYPTVGASGVVVFLYGCFVVQHPTRNVLINLGVFVAINVVTYIFANTNIWIHLFAFVYGACFALLHRLRSDLLTIERLSYEN